jgi:peroxiredoxin
MRYIIVFLMFTLWACGQNPTKFYRVELEIQGQKLPFFMEFSGDSVFLINGPERLEVGKLQSRQDSFVVDLLSFNAELVFKMNPKKISGYWKKLDALDYQIALQGEKVSQPKFRTSSPRPFGGKFEVEFIKPDGSRYLALGIFSTQKDQILGTFLTSSGDYRYLAGAMEGDSLRLSCFDGTHAYLFKAELKGDSVLGGVFWSGKNRKLSWRARRNESFALPEASSLTYLKDNSLGFSFSFPNLQGKTVSSSDYLGKVLVVQILGSWCPNCMDETRFLADFHKRYRSRGFEVLGLAFETAKELQAGGPMLKKFSQKLGVEYEMLLVSTPDSASQALPMLNKVSAFPTSIFIDKKGKVSYIHTGFSGPATGNYYQDWVEDFTLRIEKLLSQ